MWQSARRFKIGSGEELIYDFLYNTPILTTVYHKKCEYLH